MARRRPFVVALLLALGAAVLLLALELVSIERWSSLSASGGGTVGVIEYRSWLGGLNRLTMTINEIALWPTGARFQGLASYGTFNRWMHTYAR